jgi:S-adenosylmethionine:tRNA ribosyltransferase-isomerase
VVLVSDFDYDLPEALIAQTPLADRSASRMLVVDRAKGRWEDCAFTDFPSYLHSGDRLVVNNTKVLPARLFGRRTGIHATTSKQQPTGLIEVLLLKQVDSAPLRWEALVRPGRKLRSGEKIHFAGGLDATIVGRGERGLRVIEFEETASFFETLERIGHTPLPPYIKRADETADRERYQTVYANRVGSVAAPTAGLHFTPEILRQIESRGVVRVEVTLHVGLGTFQPVEAAEVAGHKMHAESYEISEAAAAQLRDAPRIVAAGTTTARTLEHAMAGGRGNCRASSGETNLFIYPGYEFRAVDALLTNFHLPRSTLLMLVCALGGKDLILEAYRHAVREKYRFYSYGDCMLVI